jgi:hypothetical protein
VFHDLKNVKLAKKSLIIGQLHVANFSYIFFKLVDGAPATNLKFDIFLIYMLLGI